MIWMEIVILLQPLPTSRMGLTRSQSIYNALRALLPIVRVLSGSISID